VDDPSLFVDYVVYIIGPTLTDTPSPTITNTSPPTNTRTITRTPTTTRTRTRTSTPSATPTPACGADANYVVTQGTGTLIGGNLDIGNHCDTCGTYVTLPFPFKLYGQSYTVGVVDDNGTVQFTSETEVDIACLPTPDYSNTIFAYWADML